MKTLVKIASILVLAVAFAAAVPSAEAANLCRPVAYSRPLNLFSLSGVAPRGYCGPARIFRPVIVRAPIVYRPTVYCFPARY